MSRETKGHTGPHATRAGHLVAPSMVEGRSPPARRAIKKNHNRKSRQWLRRVLNGKVEP